jgi:hypothetical protein
MDITLKYKIVEKIIQSNDEKVLNEIKSILGLSEIDFWDELPDYIKLNINTAKDELDRCEGVPHALVMSEISKYRFPVV